MNRNLRPLRRTTLAVTALSLVLGLEACSKLFTETPRPLYRLEAPFNFASGLPHTDAQIVIAMPYAPEGLEPRRIAVIRAANALDYLADGEWADRTPAMIRAVLIESFENSKSVAAVGPDSLDLRADFVIEGDLRHFEAVYDSQGGAPGGAPTVVATMAVKLVKVPEHKIVAQTIITARETAAANATPQIVAAFNAAAANLGKQVVTWTLTNPALSVRRR